MNDGGDNKTESNRVENKQTPNDKEETVHRLKIRQQVNTQECGAAVLQTHTHTTQYSVYRLTLLRVYFCKTLSGFVASIVCVCVCPAKYKSERIERERWGSVRFGGEWFLQINKSDDERWRVCFQKCKRKCTLNCTSITFSRCIPVNKVRDSGQNINRLNPF